MKVRRLTGLDEARQKLAQSMAERYQITIAEALQATSVTHVSPRVCPCYGCYLRRAWQRK